MKKIAIAFLAATSLASFGCKKKGGAEAMEMMKKYKTDLCACKDHDLDCGKKATDAYQKSMADWAAKNTGEKADPSAKPDPEAEKLTTEVADCSKRVMTPDMGGAGGGAGGGMAGGAAAGGGSAEPAAGGAAAGGGSAEPAAGGAAAGGGSAEPAAAGSAK